VLCCTFISVVLTVPYQCCCFCCCSFSFYYYYYYNYYYYYYFFVFFNRGWILKQEAKNKYHWRLEVRIFVSGTEGIHDED